MFSLNLKEKAKWDAWNAEKGEKYVKTSFSYMFVANLIHISLSKVLSVENFLKCFLNISYRSFLNFCNLFPFHLVDIYKQLLWI